MRVHTPGTTTWKYIIELLCTIRTSYSNIYIYVYMIFIYMINIYIRIREVLIHNAQLSKTHTLTRTQRYRKFVLDAQTFRAFIKVTIGNSEYIYVRAYRKHLSYLVFYSLRTRWMCRFGFLFLFTFPSYQAHIHAHQLFEQSISLHWFIDFAKIPTSDKFRYNSFPPPLFSIWDI